MALETSVNESNWVLQSGGNENDSFSSTFQRREPEPDENGNPVYVTKNLSVAFVDQVKEYKYFALTQAAVEAYVLAHPELKLSYSRVNQVGDGFTLTKRVASRETTGYTLSDVPEA